MKFSGTFYVGRCPTPHQPFEKGWAKTFAEWVRLNFTSFWDGEPRSGCPSAPSQDTDKESSLSFRCYGLWRALGRRRRPQNDLDIGTYIVFALSFVWRKGNTHIARCKSFRPAFFELRSNLAKAWRVWAEPSVLFDKSKCESKKGLRIQPFWLFAKCFLDQFFDKLFTADAVFFDEHRVHTDAGEAGKGVDLVENDIFMQFPPFFYFVN